VHNRIPPPLHYGLVETIASKLTRPLPVAVVTVLTYADGDFGRTDSRRIARTPISSQRARMADSWHQSGGPGPAGPGWLGVLRHANT